MTKNIQVIDGADNSEYAIFEVSDEVFSVVFPEIGQDIEFVEDLEGRISVGGRSEFFQNKLYCNQIDKILIQGIHGTLFVGLEFKRKYYPNKRSGDLI
ncbi:MAG: hypothetical protein QM698_00755 [Micropepsaceae bacterium]